MRNLITVFGKMWGTLLPYLVRYEEPFYRIWMDEEPYYRIWPDMRNLSTVFGWRLPKGTTLRYHEEPYYRIWQDVRNLSTVFGWRLSEGNPIRYHEEPYYRIWQDDSKYGSWFSLVFQWCASFFVITYIIFMGNIVLNMNVLSFTIKLYLELLWLYYYYYLLYT